MAVVADNWPNIRVDLVDIDTKRINEWNNEDLDKLPVYEPGLKEIVRKNRNKNLFFSHDIENCIKHADMIFISVNTPTKTTGFGAGYASDLKWVESCARQVAKFSLGHTIVVEKSTVPVKTAELIQEILGKTDNSNKNSKDRKTFSVLSSPEFLAEGTAINDLENPDRVLIGGDDQFAMEQLSLIYQKWIPVEKILFTNIWSSELSKLTANAFLAQRISSINSISALCETTGAEISEVAKAIGADKRIGDRFLSAGPGFGGSCFKKDILNLVYLCNYYGLNQVAEYWEQVLLINNWQKRRISSLIVERLFGTVTNKKIAIFGCSFKSNTNDLRESPAISIAKDLLENGAKLAITDPKVSSQQIENEFGKAMNNACEEVFRDLEFTRDIYECSKDADAIVIATEWKEYKFLDWEKISNLMRKPSWIFDTRNLILEKDIKNLDLNFWQVGRN